MELSEVTGDVYLDDIDLVLPWLVMSSNEPSNSDNENNDQLKRFESNQKQFQFHTREKPWKCFWLFLNMYVLFRINQVFPQTRYL